MEEITALQESRLGKRLKQFLSEEIVEKGKGKETLLVADPKLGAFLRFILCTSVQLTGIRAGNSITKKLGIKIAADTMEGIYRDVFRGIRTQIAALLDGLDPKDLATMSLGLSHSLSLYVVAIPDWSDETDHNAGSSSNSRQTRSTPWSYKL